MDRTTVDVYRERAGDWAARKSPGSLDPVVEFARAVAPGAWRLDLACGPGWHTAALGEPVVASDAAPAMLELVTTHAPDARRVAHDLEALPFRDGAFGGIWAHKCLMHIPGVRLPLALRELFRVLGPGAPLHARLTSDRIGGPDWDDPFPGRHFTYWNRDHLERVVGGAGFALDDIVDDGVEWLDVHARRVEGLADVVGPAMRLLVVGLNPSTYAARTGVAFGRPGNRFWPAASRAGITERDRDPSHAYTAHGIGFTDLVKRATDAASELHADEYVTGAARVRALVEWLQPGVVVFVGLSGYRIAVDRNAAVGWQSASFAGRPAYVMPNPSGRNAHTNVDDLARHLAAALAASVSRALR